MLIIIENEATGVACVHERKKKKKSGLDACDIWTQVHQTALLITHTEHHIPHMEMIIGLHPLLPPFFVRYRSDRLRILAASPRSMLRPHPTPTPV